MDWNNDGMKDLLTGENNGRVRIYLNKGTDANPLFNGYDLLLQGGKPFDCGNYSSPHVVDWNNDGKKDVLCGEGNGQVWLLINEGTDPAPVFNTKVFIQDGTGNVDAGSVGHPTVCDWNRDGKKDLIVGGSTGQLVYFENKGTDAAPVFNGKSFMYTGGQQINVVYYARPDVADWNEDGVMDILCGNYETTPTPTAFVIYFESIGPLALSANMITESGGGKIGLDLNAGSANAGRDYIILGSVSGTEPGIPLPGGQATLPVNWDIMTSVMIGLLNTPIFDNFLGTLDGKGKAAATFAIGPVPGSAGLMISFAYGLNDPWDYASNGANIEVLP